MLMEQSFNSCVELDFPQIFKIRNKIDGLDRERGRGMRLTGALGSSISRFQYQLII